MKENEEILKIEDLVDGDYYKATFKENQKGLIFLLNNKIGEKYHHYFINLKNNYFEKGNILTNNPEENIYTKLNQKEIFWLNECIKTNKFIDYETAMKTFVEEDKLYDITKLIPFPSGYKDCKKGDKVILVNYNNVCVNTIEIPLGSVLIIDQDNSSLPYIKYNKIDDKLCCNITCLAPIPNEEQKEESLVGRYLKALVNNPQCTSYSKGDYVKIKLEKLKDEEVVLEGKLQFLANISAKDLWELMPIGFEPKKEISMEKEYDYEVVYCETQEQWDFVIKKENSKMSNNWDVYKESTCFCLKKSNKCPDTYSSLSYFQSKNSKIYTFSEWCKLNNYVMKEEKEGWIPKIGDWVVITKEGTGNHIVGNCYKIISEGSYPNFGLEGIDRDGNFNLWYYNSEQLRKALPHEIPNQSNQTIDIGDEVKTPDGNGIVIGISNNNSYLVKGAKKSHSGIANTYIKGGPSDTDDSYFYNIKQITLIKKAYINTRIPFHKDIIIQIGQSAFDTFKEIGIFPIDTTNPSKRILEFEIYDQKPSSKKEEFIELNINLTKNIIKPIKL